jgi:hypothetical protein
MRNGSQVKRTSKKIEKHITCPYLQIPKCCDIDMIYEDFGLEIEKGG